MIIDPQTGLPVDEGGELLSASAAGSDIISESDPQALPLAPDTPPAQSTPSSHPAANIPMPGEGLKSVSVSATGISDKQLGTVTKLNTAADRRAEADIARFQPQRDELRQGAEQNATMQREALRLQTEAQQQHLARETELWKAQQAFHQEQAELEKMAFAQSQIVRQQYLANYEQDLMSARMAAMQTGDPNERMGGAEAAGLIGQAAVQGFLRVGGHNINAVEHTERWVNREIAKHAQKVQDMRQNAQGQLHLYELARQKSRDDFEARERYRGMVLEGMKAQIGLEATRFQSQLATATAAQKAAEIDAQLLGIKSSLADKEQKFYLDTQDMRIKQAHFMAQDSIAKGHLNLAREKADAEKNQNKQLIGALKLSDPGATVRDKDGKIIGVKNMWQIDPMATDGQKKEASDLAAKEGGNYAAVKKQLDRLRQLRAPVFNDFVEKYGYQGAKARFSEEYRAYKRQKDMIAESTIQAFTGAAAPEQQMQRIINLLEDDKGFQTGSNASGLTQLEAYFRDRYVERMSQHPAIRPLGEGEQDVRAINSAENDTDAQWNMHFGGKAPSTSPVKDAATDAVKVGRNTVAREGFSPLYLRYAQETKDWAGGGSGNRGERGQNIEIDAIDTLAAIVAKPELVAESSTVDGNPTIDPATARQEALRSLQQFAAGSEVGGKAADPEVQRYAGFVISQLVNSPDAESFYQLVSGRETPQVDSPANQLTSGDYQKRMKEGRDKDRADFLRKGITGE